MSEYGVEGESPSDGVVAVREEYIDRRPSNVNALTSLE
jgi:hypothetical protein